MADSISTSIKGNVRIQIFLLDLDLDPMSFHNSLDMITYYFCDKSFDHILLLSQKFSDTKKSLKEDDTPAGFDREEDRGVLRK